MASHIPSTRQILLPFLIFACFGFSIPFPVRAEGVFSVNPLFTDIAIGVTEQQKTFALVVTNRTLEPVVLRISLVDFGSLNESGGIAFLGKDGNETNRYALASWITPEKDVVTLLPNTEESLNFMVENRESLSPGGHYGAVLFAIEEEGGMQDESAKSNISVNSSFSALIFAQKEGGVIKNLSLKEQEADARSWPFFLPKRVSLRFQNSGNVDLIPRGRVMVLDPFNRSVANGIINEDSGRILPESFRMYRVQLRPVGPSVFPGWYTVATTFRFDGEDAGQSAPPLRFFAWGLAIWWVLGLVGVIGVIGFVFRKIRRKNRV